MSFFVTFLQQNPEIPQMPRELSWAIIVLLACVLAWVIVQYTKNINDMLKSLDSAIDAIRETLISHKHQIETNKTDIQDIKKQLHPSRRKPKS